MKYSELNEIKNRGTPDFPIELYRIDSGNSRYIMPFHWHKEFEIIRVEEGEFSVCIGEEEYCASAGDVLLINSGMIHGGIPKSCVYHCVVFDPSLLLGRSNSAWREDITRISDAGDTGIRRYFPAGEGELAGQVEQLINALKTEREGNRLLALGALYSVFGLLYRNGAVTGETAVCRHFTGDAKMKAVLCWIEENYADTVTLEKLAEIAGMNPGYFCGFFKRYTQRSPVDYLNMYRIDSACRMLRVSGCSVTEAGFSCGFNDLSYFVKTFKKYKGVTPKQYRKRYESETGAVVGKRIF